jgi:hypothetical protein
VRAQELGAPSREVAKSRGAEDSHWIQRREDRWIRNPIAFRISGVQEVEGVVFDCRSREVLRAEAREGHVAEPQGGPGK